VTPRGSNAGFSLVEVLIAGGLVAGAVVTLAAVVASSVRTDLDARDRTASALLASQKIEELVAAIGGAGGALEGNDEITAAGAMAAGPGSAEALYVRRWRVEPSAAAGVMRIQAEVVRRGAAAAVATTRLVTLRRSPSP
jgi:Tfp pilus assembly protein PilV